MALENDREILKVIDQIDEVTFQKSYRKTANGFELPMLVHERLSFSPEEYLRRYDTVQAAMAEQGLDVLLVRGPENITYFTGYETPGYYKYHCVIVPKDGEPVFLVRFFEWINTPEFAWSDTFVQVFDWDHGPSVTANIMQQLGFGRGKRVGVEKQCFFYTADEHETLTREMPENLFVDATSILWNARLIKSAEEVAVMRRSAALVDKAMLAGYEATAPGRSANAINGSGSFKCLYTR